MLIGDDSSQPQPGQAPPEAPGHVEALPHVLVIEDDPAFGKLLRIWLARGRYAVTVVASGEEGINLLSAQTFDVLICDVHLAGADGFEVLRASKALRPLVPVILITGDDVPDVFSSALRNHADGLLIKPFGFDDLLQRLDEIIAAGRIARRAGNRTVLAVEAHPDDVAIGMAGTILHHVAAGDRVTILLMTDGEGGGAAADRTAEAECAAERMGVSLIRASLPDGRLADTADTVAVVESAIAESGAAMVYTHTDHDTHQDHRTTHNATMVAARSVPYVFAYQSPSSTVDFRPTRFVDIAPFLDQKLEVLKLFRSQARIRVYLADDLIRATARYWGRFAGHRIVEPLEVLRQLAQ